MPRYEDLTPEQQSVYEDRIEAWENAHPINNLATSMPKKYDPWCKFCDPIFVQKRMKRQGDEYVCIGRNRSFPIKDFEKENQRTSKGVDGATMDNDELQEVLRLKAKFQILD